METDQIQLKKIKKECFLEILSMYKKANAGHIGSSLSCLDILIYLHFVVMEKEDKFILSKGHAAAGLYAVLAQAGYFDKKLLSTFYLNATNLAAHPPCNRKLPGVHFGTGSLGHGLSLAAGFALSNRFTHKSNKVFCVLSEGDCNAGSTWEAALFAAQQKLSNLYVIIDNNNLQGFGKSNEVINLQPFEDKWKAFNFDVEIAENGNDFNSLQIAFDKITKNNSDKPKCIIAKTTKGSGVSYMENKLEWHYLPMNEAQYSQALREVNKL